jgi:hypothetical protein
VARVYVAAPYGRKNLASGVGSTLRQNGHRVTSGWHDTDYTPEKVVQIESNLVAREAEATQDYNDLRAADTCLLLLYPECKGALCEFTEAYLSGKTVCVVGDPFCSTLMLQRPGVKWFSTLDEAVQFLNRKAG